MKFSLSFCSKKTPDTSKHAYGSAEQTFTPLVKRSRQPRKSYRLSKPKILKKGRNLGQKSNFWSKKTQIFWKRQQELGLISSIWGRMQNLRRIVGSVFEIVKNSAEIAEYEFGHTRWNDSVANGFLRYYRRKAGGPARLRSATVVQSFFIHRFFH